MTPIVGPCDSVIFVLACLCGPKILNGYKHSTAQVFHNVEECILIGNIEGSMQRDTELTIRVTSG